MRVPPHCEELEIQILGDLMAIGSHQDLKAQKAMLQLNPKTFYKPISAELFALIRNSFQKAEPFGFMDIFANIGAEKLALYEHQARVMGDHSGRHPLPETFEFHIHRLISLETARRNIAKIESALTQAYSMTDPVELNSMLRESAKQVCQIDGAECSTGIYEHEVIDEIQSGLSDEQSMWPTSSEQLNSHLGGGVMSGSLITVAGSAGIGKTGYAIWLMDAIASQQEGKQALFFSLEMRPSEIVKRHLGIKAGKLFANLSYQERTQAIADALNYPLKLYDYKHPDLDFILTASKLDAAKQPVSVIVIDYLTLVTNRGNFERNDLRQADITSKFAWLAADLDCIVVALSQVNRSAAHGEDHCPQPHHAADSSGSHRSSHLWLGIDRPETYLDDPCYRDQFVIKCRKNRTGDHFEMIMSFNSGTFREMPFGYFKKAAKPEKSTPSVIYDAAYKPHHG